MSRKYTLDESVFKVIDTEEKAYWLGFILADGCIIDRLKQNRQAKYLSIQLKISDIGHLEKFRNFIKTDKPIYKVKQKLKDKIPEGCSIHISCSKLAEDLVKLGVVPRKSLNETIPSIDEKLNKHFLRGFWDGDGSILFYDQTKNKIGYETPEVCIYSGQTAITQIREIIKKDLNLDLSILRNRTLHKLKTSGSKAKKITEYLYKDATIYLDRKFQVANKIFNFVGKRGV